MVLRFGAKRPIVNKRVVVTSINDTKRRISAVKPYEVVNKQNTRLALWVDFLGNAVYHTNTCLVNTITSLLMLVGLVTYAAIKLP